MREVTKCHVGRWVMGSTPLEYCWFIYKIGARTGRLTGQFETYALSFCQYRVNNRPFAVPFHAKPPGIGGNRTCY